MWNIDHMHQYVIYLISFKLWNTDQRHQHVIFSILQNSGALTNDTNMLYFSCQYAIYQCVEQRFQMLAISKWLGGAEWTVMSGKKVGGFLSDISGAFDQVFVPYLLAKLYEKGVGEKILRLLATYLAPRRGQVVVQGAFSNEMEISNSVFQGTVWGPPLWNSFFSDVATPAKSTGGSEEVYADDLNVFKEFDETIPAKQIREDLETCRHRVHKWGVRNRVSFDPAKEHIVVIHPSKNEGESFKLLGCMVDPDLGYAFRG